jgi:glycosyltransferase involved in cell wall biosynthesis
VAMVVRWIYRHNDLLLVQSRSFIAPVSAMAGGTAVVYHPNPGDMVSRDSTPDEPALQLKPGFNVVFAGNLGTVQALDTILDAAERTRDRLDLWWVIIGSGSRGEWLQEQVKTRSLSQVVLPGRFPPEAMPKIFAQASALLVTLVRSPIMSQTVPSKIQAYLAAGRPVVAALDGEGARVVVEAGAGLACPAEDAAALAKVVVDLAALPEHERLRMGNAGREYYREHFDPERLLVKLLEHFRALRATDSIPETDRG